MKKIILTMLLSLCMATPAIAQESHIFIPPGTDYDNTGAKVNAYLKQQSFATTNKEPVGTVNVSLVHPEYLEADQFGLLLTKANTTTGCFSYSPLEYEATYIENHYMDINVKHYRKEVIETKDPTYDCSQRSQVISGIVILSISDLKHRGVKQIRFNNGQARDTYNVSATANGIRLTPESMIAFKAQNLQGIDKTYIEYNLADNSIVKLQVPMAEQSDKVGQAVRDLAYKNSLKPILEHDTIDINAENNVFYFEDINGTTSSEIGTTGYTEFGTINVIRPYDGPNGRVAMPVPLKVFLTRQNVTL